MNNTIQISRYLQNEMSIEERSAFEIRLASDEELQNELKVQQQVIKAVEHAGLKAGFAQAIRKRAVTRMTVIWSMAAAACVTMMLVYNFNQSFFFNKLSTGRTRNAQLHRADIIAPCINPPLQNINVPFSEYMVDAEKAVTIFYQSGSIIYFPPAAFVDGSGNPVNGMVKVSYREFAGPLDFFVSGIPMQYDSAGRKYNFESSGMCEINAFKDNKPVFVNPHAKPQVNLSGENKSPLHNLYFLDTVARAWKYNGKDSITEVKNLAHSKLIPARPLSFESDSMPVKPVKPWMADIDHQAFSIEIDPGSFEELTAYDKLKFEVIDESTYRRSDADVHWESVKLDHTITEGIYNITFTNSKRKASYKVRPVLEGNDYDAALKNFKEKSLAYEQALERRQVNDKKLSDSISMENKKLNEQAGADMEWNNKMNALIIARNKKMKALKQMELPDDEKATIAAKQRIQDQLLLVNRNQWKAAVDMALSSEIIRTFTINNFGVWNCDHPRLNNEVPLIANYTDSLNARIPLTAVAVVYKGFNGIMQFLPQMQIRVIPGQENMIWGIMDSSFYYFTYKDFAEAGIQKNTREFTFRMRRAKKQISSYNDIGELVEKL